MKLLTEAELSRIERDYAGGISTEEILEIFSKRGFKLSAATFRKYVQNGLLPKSTRVGQKGKHKGSKGVYPIRTVRRLHEIKLLLQERTIEDLLDSVYSLQRPIDTFEDALDDLLQSFQGLMETQVEAADRAELDESLARLRDGAEHLVRHVQELRDRVAEVSPTVESASSTRRIA